MKKLELSIEYPRPGIQNKPSGGKSKPAKTGLSHGAHSQTQLAGVLDAAANLSATQIKSCGPCG